MWFVEVRVLIKSIHQEIFEKAKPFLRTRKNLIHTRVALHYALKLLQSEKGDKKAIEANGTVSPQQKK